MTTSCSKCGEPAVYLRRYTGETLCTSCLITSTVQRVRRTINKRKMFTETDRIAVAISGGKDSAVLLDILYRIEQDFPRTELIPFLIDEGIHGYRDESLQAAKALTASLGLDLHVTSFSDKFGQSLDSIVEGRQDPRVTACSYCGVLRRKAINDAARELEADVVATGHNLDDEAQTVLMNIMRGDVQRIARTNRLRELTIEGFIPRVKPIMEISERDTVAYAYFQKLPFVDMPCPYATEAYRNDIREFLGRMEHKRPGTLLAVLHSGDAIAESLIHDQVPQKRGVCERCGDPTTGRICKTCQILEELQNR